MSIGKHMVRMVSVRNVGVLDRVLRALPAPIVAILVYAGVLAGPLAWLLGIVAAMLFVTALTGSCSIYYALGVSTCPHRDQAR